MARAKNRGYQQSFSPSYTIRRWRLGIYIRLSKEDLKKGKDDSNSVKNQRDLLNDFYRRNIDEFESITEYVDDGHTGTDANREDFQRLLADVMSGKINCVIVKDLSRFARNYSDAGSLIDNLFVQMGVRFISLAENVDSYKNPDSVSNIIVPITNVMNDNYCYQTSKKIRQVFDYKRRNGQYIGAFAPYGYVKHPKDKHRLIVDPDAAENVKLIFTMLIQGSSKRAIALYLNEHGVPSPSAYKVQKGLPVSTRGYDDPMQIQGISLSTTVGLFDEKAPLSQRGLGSQRLLSMGLNINASSNNSILLVDEIETGLEPYRLRSIINELRIKHTTVGQVIMTTHSPIAVAECTIKELLIVHSADGTTQCIPLESGDKETDDAMQAQIRKNAEAVLCKRIIVCEGKTEQGFIRALDTYLAREKGIRIAYAGIGTADGGGSTAIKCTKLLSSCGYDVCLFMDSDKTEEKVQKDELKNAGIFVFDWEEPNAIEEQIFNDIPLSLVTKLIAIDNMK